MRASVSANVDLPPTSGRNGFGKSWRDAGQRRVPAPPQRMTGTITGASPRASTGRVLPSEKQRRWEPSSASGDFVNLDALGHAFQRLALEGRHEPVLGEQRGRRLVLDHRLGGVNRTVDRQVLHARGDVDGLSEIILPIVEIYGEAGAFVDADLEEEVLV